MLVLTIVATQCFVWEPSAPAQFWLNWAVNLLIGLGTLSAVVVALFKDYILSRLLPSRLELTLRPAIVPISYRTVPTRRATSDGKSASTTCE